MEEDEKNKYIYCFTNKLNNKKYIGQTINPNQRYAVHKYYTKNDDRYFYRALRKHGLENFTFEVIRENLSWKEADEIETQLIAELNTIWPNGYNIAPGGTGKSNHTRKLISENKKERWKNLSDEEKNDKIQQLRNSRLGKQQSSHQKECARKANQKRWLITYPDGRQQEIVNLRQFCKDNGLKYGASNLSGSGTYKGYKAKLL